MTGMMRHIHVILMLLVMLITVTCDAKDHTLTIAVQLPLSGYMADMGQRTLSSIQFAASLLNNQSTILANHSIVLSIIDTESLPYVALQRASLQLESLPSPIGVIGDIRSIVSMPLASLAAVHLSYQCFGDGVLADKSLFPLFARTIPNNNDHSMAVIDVLQYYQWRCAIILSSRDTWANELAASMSHTIASLSSNRTLMVERIISYDANSTSSINDAITAMLSLNCRIVVITAPWSSYQSVLAAIPSSAVNFTFIAASLPLQPIQDMPSGVVGNHISVIPSLSSASSSLVDDITNHCTSYCDHNDMTSLYAYDALMVYANAAHGLITRDGIINITSSMIWSQLSSISFIGASGHVTLNDNGDRIAMFDIIQPYISSIPLGTWNGSISNDVSGASLIMTGNAIWYGNASSVPIDWFLSTHDAHLPATPPTIIWLSPILQITTWVIMSLLLLTSIFLHVLLVKYRDHTVIRSSAIQYCHIMVAGATIGYIAAGVTVVQKTNQAVCTTPTLLLGIAFALIIGALVDKTSRMKLIFAAKRLKMKEYSGPALLVRISLLLACEIVVQLVWNLVDAPTPQLMMLDQSSNQYAYQCHSNYPALWWILLLLPKVVTLGYAVWLAYQIRDIHSHWNESKWLATCIYHVLIVATVVLVIIALGGHVLDALQALIVFGIFLSIFGVMAIFFGSKFYNMFVSLDFLSTLPQSNVQLQGHRRSSRSIDFGGAAMSAFLSSPFPSPATINVPTTPGSSGNTATAATTTTNGDATTDIGNGATVNGISASILAASSDAQRVAQQQVVWNLLGNTGVMPANGLAGVSMARLAQLGSSPPPHLRRASNSYNRLPGISGGSTTSNPNGVNGNDGDVATPISRRNTLRDNQMAQMRGVIRGHSGSRLPMTSPRATHHSNLNTAHFANNNNQHGNNTANNGVTVTAINSGHNKDGTSHSPVGHHGIANSMHYPPASSPDVESRSILVVTEPPAAQQSSKPPSSTMDATPNSGISEHHLTALSSNHHHHNNSVSTTLLLSPVASSADSANAFSSSFDLSPSAATAASSLASSFDTITPTRSVPPTMSINGNSIGNADGTTGITGSGLVPLTLSTSMSDGMPAPSSSSSMVTLVLPGSMQSTSPPQKKRSSASPSSRRSSMARPPPSPIPEGSSSSSSGDNGLSLAGFLAQQRTSPRSGGTSRFNFPLSSPPNSNVTPSSPPNSGIRPIRLVGTAGTASAPASSSLSSITLISPIVVAAPASVPSSSPSVAPTSNDERTVTPIATNERTLQTPSPPPAAAAASSATNNSNGVMTANGGNGSRHSYSQHSNNGNRLSPVFASSNSGRTLLGPLIVHTPSPVTTPLVAPLSSNNSSALNINGEPMMIDTLLSTHGLTSMHHTHANMNTPPFASVMSNNSNNGNTVMMGTLSSPRPRSKSEANTPTPPTRSPSLVARPSPRGSIAT